MLNITERREGLVSVLDLDGDLNEENCSDLQKYIKRLYGEKRYWIVLDLNNVGFIGSHALGILLFADREAREGKGRLKLLKPQPAIRMIFDGTRTKYLFEIFDKEASAINSF